MRVTEKTINLILFVPVISSDEYKVMVLLNHFSRFATCFVFFFFPFLVKRNGVVLASGINCLHSGDRYCGINRGLPHVALQDVNTEAKCNFDAKCNITYILIMH